MFQNRGGEATYFDVIPRTVNDYLGSLRPIASDCDDAWAILYCTCTAGRLRAKLLTHDGTDSPRFLAMLLNLAAVSNDKIPSVLWGFFAATIPRPRLKRLPGLDNWFAMQSLIFATLFAPRRR